MKPDNPKVRRRIQRMGRVFGVIAFLVLLAAWNTGTNLLYIIFAGLVSFMLLSIFLGKRNLRKTRLVQQGPQSVHRGQEALLTLFVENGKRYLPSVGLRLESPDTADGPLAHVIKVPPKGGAIVHAPQSFPKRGLWPLPDVTICSTFPFGLAESRVTFEGNGEVLVFPRVWPVTSEPLREHEGAGRSRKPAGNQGAEFFSLRDYVRGDDTRLIAWRRSARTGTLVVKELEMDTVDNTVLVLDTQEVPADPDFEEHFETAVELAASLAVELLRRNHVVSLCTPDHETPPASGQSQQRRIMDILARIEPVPFQGKPFQPEHMRTLEAGAVFYLTADAQMWGQRGPGPDSRVMGPKEVIRG